MVGTGQAASLGGLAAAASSAPPIRDRYRRVHGSSAGGGAGVGQRGTRPGARRRQQARRGDCTRDPRRRGRADRRGAGGCGRTGGEGLAAAERSEAEGRSAAGVGIHSRLVLGWIQLADGDAVQARDSMASVADAARSSIFRILVALPLILLADAHVSLGAIGEAEAALEEAISMAESREQTWLLGRAGIVCVN